MWGLAQALGALILLAPGLSQSDTILVPGNQPTIQSALNVAGSGDTVLVAAGTYVGSGNRNLDFLGKSVVLRSSAGPATTIIDCQGAARGFRFHTNETAATFVDGFSIRNGNALGANGGGMSIESASPTIRHIIFTSCQANDGAGVFLTAASPSFTLCQFNSGVAVNSGGAVYGEAQSGPSFWNCAVSQNTAPFGGGVYLTATSAVTMRGCTFTGNESVTYGGGIYSRGSALTLDFCSWSTNSAKRGAAIYCVQGASASVDSCDFISNTAGEAGGAAFCDHAGGISFTHSEFTENRTQLLTQPNAGGGIYCFLASSFLIEDCTFTANTCAGNVGKGGGIFYSGAAIPVEIARCDFLDNSAGWGAGASIEAENVTITDCEFTNNTAMELGGGLSGGNSIVRCTFTRNHAGTIGGGIHAQGGVFLVQDCAFADNTAINVGGGLYRNPGLSNSNIVRSIFHDNSASVGGAAYFIARGQSTLTDCTLYNNSAAQGAALYVDQGQLPLGVTTLSGCTVANNIAPIGAGLVFGGPAIIGRSIIAFGENGNAVSCFGAGMPTLSCTDIFGNAGGDWTACISDQLGINGNFAADPRFCAPLAGDFTLAADSPCAPAHSPAGCGTIGSQPVGCQSPIGISDVAAPPVTPNLRIYPNPLRTTGVIEWGNFAETVSDLKLYDASGRLVINRALMPQGTASIAERMSWSEFLSTKRLAPGVYFLKMYGVAGAKLDDQTVVVLP